MSVYKLALFLHVLGALGLFAGLGIEWAAAGQLRRATDAGQAGPWIRLLASVGRVAGPSGAALLITGIYMAMTAWSRQAWTGLGLLGMLFMGLLAARVTGRRIAALARGLASGTEDPLRLNDPLLVVSLRLRTALATGIIFLMTVKPAAGLALAAMGAAVALGLAWSAPALGRRRSAGVGLAP